MKPHIIAWAICASTVASSVLAQEAGTLEKVKKDGVITLGVRESSVPFSYYDDQQKIVGYSADLCAIVVASVKQKLNLPNLTVKEIPTTSQNRLPLIINGTVDLECGSTTNNTDRAKQVAFSDTIFVIGTRLLVKKASGIKGFSDLDGKTVVTTAGTTSEKILREMNYKKKMNMNVISAKDHGEAFLTLQSGRAVAFMMDDALLYGQLAKSADAKDFEVVGTPQSFEAYGLVMRKNDPAFQALVNQSLVSSMKSGMIEQLYKKWFMSPIPPKDINLNFPMTAEVKDHYLKPDDKPYQ
ncbi:glutamate/aspartate ABC transporter substrate-binding protein [Paraburkholderia sp. MM5482-R1]|uniref:glutamate/aspartate ABC transporter substrate-binding protein n=1 Tax=unclassified Paraburkholderia TaxID=2615204 RepID=UPI003D2240DF